MAFNIGFIGVPGSGKSELAQALVKALEYTDLDVRCKGCLTPISVIDDYVPALEERTDLVLNDRATYIGNLHVALERESLERNARNNAATVITCGTIFETATYCAQGFEFEQQYLSDEAERQDLFTRIEATFRMFGCLYIDTLRYTHMFYLPPILNQSSNELLDRNLQAAFSAFKLQEVVNLGVEGGDTLAITESRVDKVIETLDILEKDESNVEGAGASASKPV